MPICSTCKQNKDSDEFSRSANKLSGRDSRCKGCERLRNRKYKDNNVTKIRKYRKVYNKENKESINKYNREYQIKNRTKITQRKLREKKLNVLLAIHSRISRRILGCIKAVGGSTKEKTIKVVGCTQYQLLQHLNISDVSQLKGMHIDHIAPISLALTEDEVYKLNHYSNLRIIPAAENLAKSDSWTPEGAMMCLILLGREWPAPAQETP